MKFDINALRYLSQEEFRVLTAVEMGQKNVRPRLLELPARERSCKGHACVAHGRGNHLT